MNSPRHSNNGWIDAAILQIMTSQGRIEAQTTEILRRIDKPKSTPKGVPWYRDKWFLIWAAILASMVTGHMTWEQIAEKLLDKL